MTRLQVSDNQAAQTAGKAMEAFWDSPDRDKIIDEHWAARSTDQPDVAVKNSSTLNEKNVGRPVTRSATRAIVQVARLNDKLVTVYADAILHEASNQLTSSTTGDGNRTPGDLTVTPQTSSQSLCGSYAKTKAYEQSAGVTNPTDDELDADVDAQAGRDDLGATVEVNEDAEDVAVLNELSIHSPFCDLIKDLYGLKYGHDSTKMELVSKYISSPLLNELHAHAEHLLKSWRADDPIHQKQLLVALSCIINTIDGDNKSFYAGFADFKMACTVEGFMTPTTRQLEFVDRMLRETGFHRTADLDTLDIWSLRHACDLRVSMRRESPLCLVPKKPVELFSWEAKISGAGSTQLQVQRCKNLRLNTCLIGTTHSIAGLDRKQSPYPLPSPLLLDIAGRNALPYKIQKIDDDVFVAGAVMEDKSLISLPRTKEDMVDFLKEGGLTALLSVKALNDEYARIIKDGMRRVKKEEVKNRMLGYGSMLETRNPIINTPTKKHKVVTPPTTTAKKARLSCRSPLKSM
ncbi:hypothetical protein BG006_010622 [Podila minutissima]|uniref:Uncharacterized protein n=1 Tax=Podila minutissima TaxID=64525 RepID=A0A9P5VIM4_9FUNG|nr:hypothetical protein BG006_010622 [Podila minutissima]